MDITLHILLEKPPVDVDFGIQKGAGQKYETIQTQRSDSGDMRFDFAIQLKSGLQGADEPRFAGPFVQGKPGSQFIYIDVGEFAGQAGGWSRRIKIPLSGITWDTIAQLKNNPLAGLATQIPGAAKDGSPSYATVKPFSGWKITMPSIAASAHSPVEESSHE